MQLFSIRNQYGKEIALEKLQLLKDISIKNIKSKKAASLTTFVYKTLFKNISGTSLVPHRYSQISPALRHSLEKEPPQKQQAQYEDHRINYDFDKTH